MGANKIISDSYLYKATGYGKTLYEYLVSSDRVDKNSDGFADVIYAVKKQASPTLMKVLLSNKVVLLLSDKGVSRVFKVIRVRDVKDKRDNHKIFIDCSGIITYDNGVYTCKKVSTLIAYLITAMTYIVYYDRPMSITSNTTLIKTSTSAFVDMMLYVMGYLKVPITYSDNKERMSFVIAEYYQYCVMGLPTGGDSVYNIAKQVSGIKEKNTCDYLHTLFSFTFDEGNADIEQFLRKFSQVFLGEEEGEEAPKNRAKLTVEAFAQRWMYAYGPGTVLGLECFVPFAQILTDCNTGAYINQQNTIEKVVGAKVIVNFPNELLRVGSGNA